MLAFTYSPGPGIEGYAAQLEAGRKDRINSDMTGQDRMSPVYRNVHFLVRRLPEFTHQPVYHSLLF